MQMQYCCKCRDSLCCASKNLAVRQPQLCVVARRMTTSLLSANSYFDRRHIWRYCSSWDFVAMAMGRFLGRTDSIRVTDDTKNRIWPKLLVTALQMDTCNQSFSAMHITLQGSTGIFLIIW